MSVEKSKNIVKSVDRFFDALDCWSRTGSRKIVESQQAFIDISRFKKNFSSYSKDFGVLYRQLKLLEKNTNKITQVIDEQAQNRFKSAIKPTLVKLEEAIETEKNRCQEVLFQLAIKAFQEEKLEDGRKYSRDLGSVLSKQKKEQLQVAEANCLVACNEEVEALGIYQKVNAKNHPDSEEAFKLYGEVLREAKKQGRLLYKYFANIMAATCSWKEKDEDAFLSFLGEAIYLLSSGIVDQEFTRQLRHVDVEAISEQFKAKWKKKSSDISEKHKELEDSVKAFAEEGRIEMVAGVISEFLITNNGQLNIYIIESLQKGLVNIGAENAHFKKLMAKRLEFLKEYTEEINEILKAVRVPPRNSKTHFVVCAGLQVAPSYQLSRNSMRRFILKQYLMDFRQIVSNCFAISALIRAIENEPVLFFKDMHQLVEKGFFKRKSQEEKKRYYAFVGIPSNVQESKLTVKKLQYKTVSDNIYLWDHPVIRLACIGMQIEEPEISIRKCISQEEHTKTLREWIKEIAKMHSNDKTEAKKLFSAGIYYAESLFRASGMSLYENASATGDDTALINLKVYLKKFIDNNILKTISNDTKNDILTFFNQAIASRISYLYDPYCKTKENNKKEWDGGFVLYQTDGGKNIANWQRINTRNEFSRLVVRLFVEAIDNPSLVLKSSTKMELKKSAKAELFSDHFILAMVRNFDSELPASFDLAKLDFQKKTPWKLIQGGSERRVFSALMGKEIPRNSLQVVKADNPQTLLENLLQAASKSPSYNKLLISSVDHAFNFLRNRVNISKLLKDPSQISSKLENNYLNVGREIADAPIGKDAAQKLINKACTLNKIVKKTEFLAEASSLKVSLPIHTFRTRLVEIIKKFTSESKFNMLDIYLMNECLQDELSEKFKGSILNFCDSNWSEDGKHIYFAAAIHPGTREFTFIEVLEDKTVNRIFTGNSWNPFNGPVSLYPE